MFLECGSGLVAVVRRRNQSGTESFGDKKKDHFPNEMGGGLNLWPLTSTDQSRAPIGCLSLAKQTRKKKQTNKQTANQHQQKRVPTMSFTFFFGFFFFYGRRAAIAAAARRRTAGIAGRCPAQRQSRPITARYAKSNSLVCKFTSVCVCV